MNEWDLYVVLLSDPPHLRPWEIDAMDPDLLDSFLAHREAESIVASKKTSTDTGDD